MSPLDTSKGKMCETELSCPGQRSQTRSGESSKDFSSTGILVKAVCVSMPARPVVPRVLGCGGTTWTPSGVSVLVGGGAGGGGHGAFAQPRRTSLLTLQASRNKILGLKVKAEFLFPKGKRWSFCFFLWSLRIPVKH